MYLEAVCSVSLQQLEDLNSCIDMQTHASSTLYTADFDLLTSGLMHAKGLPSNVC